MTAISMLNPKAEIARSIEALSMNITAARGIQNLLTSNLGPKGTMKMLVSGSGDIKITKDGNVLLHEIPIVHPTAYLIAKASTAVDDSIGDGTTSTVLLIGEILKQADIYLSDGIHPRILCEGLSEAQKKINNYLLDKFKTNIECDKCTLLEIAQSCLSTKLQSKLANAIADICVDAVLSIQRNDSFLDLNMIEVIAMKHQTANETVLINGLVLDHGSRHPDMPKRVSNAYILTCNVSLEYEKSEVNSSFFYKTAAQRELMVSAERDFINKRIEKVILLKNKMCDNSDKSFVLINQKGIDIISLDMLANAGIIALRRAKSRNMERLTLACGGISLNTFDDLSEHHLGYAGSVYEHVLGEDKFTFVEQCKFPQSVTILIKGPDKHTLTQVKEAVKDGLRGIKNAIEDKCLIPGAGAYEIGVHNELVLLKNEIKGKSIFGIQAFADALLIIPKVLAANSGFQSVETLAKLQDEYVKSGFPVGLNIHSGEAINPANCGIFDNYSVKKQYINTAITIATNLILVDEVIRAGLTSLKG